MPGRAGSVFDGPESRKIGPDSTLTSDYGFEASVSLEDLLFNFSF